MTRNIAFLLLCGVALSGCSERSKTDAGSTGATATEEMAAPEEMIEAGHADTTLFDDAYAAAEAALAEAAANRNVWGKTENLLQLSKAANSDGRVDEAITLANEAKLQAELAIAQTVREKEAWQSRVLAE